MLHWLAGAKAPDGSPGDPDATGYLEAPETPAPVFAVRAFKHAIFGTPQTVQPKPRRHSNAENGRQRNTESRPARPTLNRPKSASDAQAVGKVELQSIPEPLSSPTKGILMSPGTVAAKKKNVTFGEDVAENEEKRPLKSGLPDDCPGKFPSPWHKSSGPDRDDEPMEKGKGRSKLTEALEQARDETRKRKPKEKRSRRETDDDDSDVPPEFADPRSESGKYWKREYDIYRTNTQREVKKLITKQRAAKSFAQTKDQQCIELADQLRQEEKKAESLEARTAELTDQIKDVGELLKASQDTERKYVEEIAMLRRQLGRKDSARPASADGGTNAPVEVRSLDARSSNDSAKERKPVESVQRASEFYKTAAESEKPKTDLQTLRTRLKPKTDTAQAKPSDDIWAQSFRSSASTTSRTTERSTAPSRGGRAVTSGTTATPLMTLNLNTLPTAQELPRADSPQSLDVEAKSMPEVERQDGKSSPVAEEDQPQKKISPPRSPGRPLPAPPLEAPPKPPAHSSSAPRSIAEEILSQDLSLPVPQSSSFVVDPKASIGARTAAVAAAGARPVPEPKLVPTPNMKENISPASKTRTETHVKPSVMWTSINAPQAQQPAKRTTSMTAKDGREVNEDRIEAARARIAARRVAS